MKKQEKKKRTATSIKKNFVMNAILTLSSVIFPLITFPYVSRILLPEGMGKVSFATSFIAYFCMFAQMGIPTYGIRACAKVRDDKEELTKTAQELLIMNLVMSAAVYAVLFLVLICIPRFRAERTLYMLVSVTIFLNAIGMEWLYKALEQYRYITIRSVFFKFIAVLAMLIFIHKSEDYVIYGGITIFAASASNILNFINAHQYIKMKPVGGYCFRRHMKPVIVFFAMSCATTVYTNLDTVMLGIMTTNTDVGLYNAAIKIKAVLVGIVTSLGAVLLPRASYYVEKGNLEEFYNVSKKAVRFIFLAAVPMMVFFMIYAKPCIMLLSGTDFEGAVLPMQIIMPTLLFIGLSNLLGIQMLIPLGLEKIVLYSEIAGAVVDLLLNYILIPKYAAAGAATGTLVAEAVVLVVQYAALRTEVRSFFMEIPYRTIILSVTAGSVASVWILGLKLNSFVTLAVASCLFFGAYLMVLVWRKEKLLMELLKTYRKETRGERE